ncbi:hypothetical protein B0H16DRAFT_1472501 [Mycena metata]|uniref:Uncharacterized protein n=1 Tax=Mycena metata TaxID=1033252 RepID=A0AAD7HP47_9AGAR|nr:hypothetical protein B0H16DRAFT_1472501 [Mycena metata]
MATTYQSVTPAPNDMRSPYTDPLWPAPIRSVTEIQAYVDDPANDTLANAVYKVDFFPPKGDSYERSSTVYLRDDAHTPFAFTLFGQLGGIDPARRSVVIGCPEDCSDRVKVLFAYQTEALMAPVLDDDFTAKNIRAAVCTNGSRVTGEGGRYIELRLGHATIIHTGNGPNLAKRQISSSEEIPLQLDDWVLIKGTYHVRVDEMGDLRREYETYAWHIRSVCGPGQIAEEDPPPYEVALSDAHVPLLATEADARAAAEARTIATVPEGLALLRASQLDDAGQSASRSGVEGSVAGPQDADSTVAASSTESEEVSAADGGAVSASTGKSNEREATKSAQTPRRSKRVALKDTRAGPSAKNTRSKSKGAGVLVESPSRGRKRARRS